MGALTFVAAGWIIVCWVVLRGQVVHWLIVTWNHRLKYGYFCFRLTRDAAQGEPPPAHSLHQPHSQQSEQEVGEGGKSRQPDGQPVIPHARHLQDGGAVVPASHTEKQSRRMSREIGKNKVWKHGYILLHVDAKWQTKTVPRRQEGDRWERQTGEWELFGFFSQWCASEGILNIISQSDLFFPPKCMHNAVKYQHATAYIFICVNTYLTSE